MRLEPLSRLRFGYPQGSAIELRGEGGSEEQHFYFAEGRAEGKISGRFRGLNFPRRRTDHTAVTLIEGVIETDDGSTFLVKYRGYGRRHTPEYDRLSPGGTQWVAIAFHFCDSPKYSRLKDSVCVGAGQVRPKPKPDPANPSDLVLDVSEMIWEPIPE